MSFHRSEESAPKEQRQSDMDWLTALLREFDSLYPTDEACLDALTGASNSSECRNCKSAKTVRDKSSRSIKCTECKTTQWITSGTFFENIKLPRAWLAAIFFREKGALVNPSQFRTLLKTSYSTAWTLDKKLNLVINDLMQGDASVVNSSAFRELVMRRSKETNARSHPNTEQDQYQNQSVDFTGHSGSKSASKEHRTARQRDSKSTTDFTVTIMPEKPDGDEIVDVEEIPTDQTTHNFGSPAESKIYQLLSTEESDFDSLCRRSMLAAGEVSSALIMLEIAGIAKSAGANKYVKRALSLQRDQSNSTSLATSTQISTTLAALIERIKNSVKFHFQGISRKYLQLFLANFWCHVDRVRWQCGEVLDSCRRAKPIKDADVSLFVTPLMVRIHPDRTRLPDSAVPNNTTISTDCQRAAELNVSQDPNSTMDSCCARASLK